GDRHRAIENEGLDLTERATEHASDVRLLVAFGELDRFREVVLLEELRELGSELAGFLLRFAKTPPLLDHDGEGVHGHDRKDPHNALGEVAHRVPEIETRQIHSE